MDSKQREPGFRDKVQTMQEFSCGDLKVNVYSRPILRNCLYCTFIIVFFIGKYLLQSAQTPANPRCLNHASVARKCPEFGTRVQAMT